MGGCVRAAGCPDLYRRHVNGHMFQGVVKPHASLLECQRSCLEERNCLGVDWIKLDSRTQPLQRCYFVYPESTRYAFRDAQRNTKKKKLKVVLFITLFLPSVL